MVADQAPSQEVTDLAELLELLAADPWAGAHILRRTLPTVPHIEALPAASAEWRGKLAVIRGDGAVTDDRIYFCRLLSSGSYEWTAWL